LPFKSALFLCSLSVCLQAQNVRLRTNLQYQPPPLSQSLDLVLPAEKETYPAVLVLHGGSFGASSRKDVQAFCAKLARSGFAAVAVDYRTPPRHFFPAPLADVKSA